MSGCSGPAVTPVCCHRCFLRLDDAFTLPVTTWAFDDGQLLGQEFSIIAPTWTAPLLRAHRRASLGAAGRHPWGWRRIQARRSTCLLLLAVQRRRVESLVLGALSSSPVHRALVLVLGTNIAVLLDCSSRLDSVAFLTYLLTYYFLEVIHSNRTAGRKCIIAILKKPTCSQQFVYGIIEYR